MEFSLKQTIKITAYLLLALAITQGIYTLIYIQKLDFPRGYIWGLEGVLFTVLAAFAGAAMVQVKKLHVGWSAIAFSSVLNMVQVSVGLTMFGTFSQASGQVEGLAPAMGGVVAFSFMIYYAAKILLGFAALSFGMAEMKSGVKALGGLTALVGGVALVSNILLVIGGRGEFIPSGVGGASGVAATLLLALCLIKYNSED